MKFFTKKRLIPIIILTLVFWIIFNFGFKYSNFGTYTEISFWGIRVAGEPPQVNGSVVITLLPPSVERGFPFRWHDPIVLEESFRPVIYSLLNLAFYFGLFSLLFWIFYKLRPPKKDSNF
jgi:hypothetical protein